MGVRGSKVTKYKEIKVSRQKDSENLKKVDLTNRMKGPGKWKST